MYKRNNQGWLKHIDFILIDAVTLQLTFVLAYIIRHGFIMPYANEPYRILAIMLFATDILIAAVFNTMHNVLKRGPYKELVATIKHCLLIFVIITLFMFSLQSGEIYSRIVVYLTSGLHIVVGYAVRMAWKPFVRRIIKDRPKATMLLVADENVIPEILSRMGKTANVKYAGLVVTNRDAQGEEIEGIKVVANLSNAGDYICREWVNEVFVYLTQLSVFAGSEITSAGEAGGAAFRKSVGDAESAARSDAVSELIEQCCEMSVPVHIRLPLSNIGGKNFIEKVGGYNVLTSTSNYATPMQFAVKRTIDIIGGLLGSLVALVVIAVLARRIKKESPGPVLFKQTRVGLNGKKFKIYKIRSMYMDAEERKQELMQQNRVSGDMMFKLDWDPRIIGNKIVDGKQVTGIGEKIRSGSWDEWPQFFNVLLGQMSLVGTRPPTVDEWEKYKYHHRARLSAKPGITGMWQVSGRSRITDFEEVVKLDTQYINNWSIGLDFKILFKTLKAVFKKDGAM